MIWKKGNKIYNTLKEHFDILEKNGIHLKDLFTISKTPFIERFIRKYFSGIINLLPVKIRYFLTDIIKLIRNPKKELKLNYPYDFKEYQICVDQINELGLSPWENKKAVISISHDVDNIEGYNFVGQMAKIDSNYGLETTFNFITHDYSIDKKLVRSLTDSNHEVGLHGFTHDQGFAFRSPNKIRDKLLRSKEILGIENIFGYRSPALSISPNLFEVLHELNFLYDSTMQIASPFYKSVKLPYPFYLENYNIWEIPLMVQDDNYLRDTNSDKDAIFSSIKKFIEQTIAINGVLVINMHPHLMVKYQSFYIEFLQFIKGFENHINYCSTLKVIEYAKSNANNN